MHVSPGSALLLIDAILTSNMLVTAAALSLEKTPEIGTVIQVPISCAASPHAYGTGEEGAYEFRDFCWVHPRGPWGSS